MIKIFDTHAHYDDSIYDEDREELFKKMYKEGVSDIALIGASLDNSEKAGRIECFTRTRNQLYLASRRKTAS